MNVKERVTNIMAKHVKVENLKESDELKSLGLDSLDLVEVAMEIEEEFNIQFEMDDIAAFNTLGDVLKIIENKVK